MSRRSFRARVDAPRPASAWVLVTVASATLWITGQLAPWAIGLQGAALLVSLGRRERPFAWQRSSLWLNAGMAAILAASVVVGLRGGPSTIALAHFAALAQGLQLLDARPRHTEFLLVTLALFQVVLASNLTDSVFFPPLLVVFVLAAVWTLMVHTLRTEALEAGDPRGVSRAITPGLLQATLLASGLAVALALVLFVALPRLRSNIVSGSAFGASLSASGFSDRVELGEIGRIRRDPRVVMRIETLEGNAPEPGDAYWRGLAFDRFDGRSWSITPGERTRVAGSAEGGVGFGSDPEDVALLQRIVREPVEAGALFRMGELRSLRGSVRNLEQDSSGGLYAAGQAEERLRYTVATQPRSWGDAALRRDHTEPDHRHRARDLQLPELGPGVAELAREITRDLETDADRLRALERHLMTRGRYTNTPPVIDASAGISPVEAFLLGELAGHCEYFASGMVVLARSLGMPARLVNGFAGGRQNEIGDFVEVAHSDAHSWVEVRYARAGWVRYDPTPADLRARPAGALSLGERARQLASALELWWFQSVVGFDRSDQIYALKSAWLAWRRALHADTAPQPTEPARPPQPADWRGTLADAAPGVGAVLLLALLVAAVRRRRAAAGRRALPDAYATALRLLARRGLVRGPADTARDFAVRVRGAQPAPVAASFECLTELYLAERFGRRAAPTAPTHLRALRGALARARR